MSKKSTHPSEFDEEQQNDSAKMGIGVDWATQDEFVPPPQPIFPKEPLRVERTVVVLNHSIVDGKLLVYDPEDKTQAWLVDARLIENKKGVQTVAQALLNERPYGWDEEISSLQISVDDIRLGLWYLGLTQKQPLDVRKTVQSLVSRGFLPIVKK